MRRRRRKETRRGKKKRTDTENKQSSRKKTTHFMHSERVAAGNERGGRDIGGEGFTVFSATTQRRMRVCVQGREC